MATKDGRSQIWYADGNGNVAGYTESVDDIAGTIIDTYNEHFGTDISIWTPETKTLQVGDTVTNWNAYEKIYGEFGIKIASKFKIDTIVFVGWLDNEIYHYYAIDEDTAYGVLTSEGRIVTTIKVIDSIPQELMEHMNSAGYNVSNIEPDVKQFEMNTIVPKWNDYIVI